MIEQFSSVDVVENEVELVVRLEGVVEADKEGVLQLHKDVLLGFGVGYFVVLHDVPLREHLVFMYYYLGVIRYKYRMILHNEI